MKYNRYEVEDFVKDDYFQKWVLNSDSMTDSFWDNWLLDFPDKIEVVEEAKHLVLLMSFNEHQLPKKDFDLIWRNIIEKRTSTEKELQLHKKTRLSRFIKITAVFLGLMGVGLGIYKQVYESKTNIVLVENESLITLELEDGTVAVLDESSPKDFVNASGDVVVKQDKNTLNYEDNDDEVETQKASLSYNVLTVPYGKKFGVTLSDGTQVFLNSGTKLRYPVSFLKNSPRNVYLDGEAFFTVSKDTSRTFTVVTDDMNTEVYGTEFNVSNYKNDHNTSTVLVEGSVGVYETGGEQQKTITNIVPGQRAVFDGSDIVVRKVEVGKYIAWKENKLLFVNDSFELIIKELERHFNVTIENKYTALNHKKFTGTFEGESLDKILSICQEHTPFNYKYNGSEIIIEAR